MARRQAEKANARQAKLAALRAEEARRRRRVWVSVGAVAGVLVVVLALVVVYAVTSSPSGDNNAATGGSSKVTKAATSVPPSVFDQVGTGAMDQSPLTPISGNHSLTRDGKPALLYVGAEYCPYCAAERWSVVAALSRFGTFSNLGQTTSSSQDVYPDTPTLSFHGADYSSPYLSFRGYETSGRDPQTPLDTMPPEDQKVFQTFNAPPYVQGQGGAIPFVDLAGKYLISGASYDPQMFQGKSHLEVAKALSDPNSKIAQSVDGTANILTAALCQQTDGKPTKVCTSDGVTAAAKMLQGS